MVRRITDERNGVPECSFHRAGIPGVHTKTDPFPRVKRRARPPVLASHPPCRDSLPRLFLALRPRLFSSCRPPPPPRVWPPPPSSPAVVVHPTLLSTHLAQRPPPSTHSAPISRRRRHRQGGHHSRNRHHRMLLRHAAAVAASAKRCSSLTPRAAGCGHATASSPPRRRGHRRAPTAESEPLTATASPRPFPDYHPPRPDSSEDDFLTRRLATVVVASPHPGILPPLPFLPLLRSIHLLLALQPLC
ncbi:hypothetical protein SETIT_2G349900v2 [Setaria italica]|uniref:Uncharacterized protein n=1 Tax=Setaria italica TaxID=4555 RepID=A0A368Q641_SETIT|nr:hypothetical protein SETIT_2G349900v2 [Setaria italica]